MNDFLPLLKGKGHAVFYREKCWPSALRNRRYFGRPQSAKRICRRLLYFLFWRYGSRGKEKSDAHARRSGGGARADHHLHLNYYVMLYALSGVPPDRRKTKLAGQETPLSRKKDTEHTGSGSSAGFGGDPAAPAQCSFCGGAPDQKLLFS